MDSWFEITLIMVAAAVALANKAIQVSRNHRRRTVRKIEQEQKRRPLDLDHSPLEDEQEPSPPPPMVLRPPVTRPKPIAPPPVVLRPVGRPPQHPGTPPFLRRPEPPPKGAPRRRVRRKTVRRVRVAAPPAKVTPERSAGTSALLRLLREHPERAREAIVIREVLGPPRALRKYRRFR